LNPYCLSWVRHLYGQKVVGPLGGCPSGKEPDIVHAWGTRTQQGDGISRVFEWGRVDEDVVGIL